MKFGIKEYMTKHFWEYSPYTKKGHKKTKNHKIKISLALMENKNVLGFHWKWNEESKKKRKEQWKGKTWSPRTMFKKRDKRLIGNQHAYVNGSSFKPYTREFSSKLKESIRKRDGFKCMVCGNKNNLAIHHIDYNKFNSKKYNLITLCKSCHSKTNIKVFRESVTTRGKITNKNWLKVWSELMGDHKKQEHKNLR